MKRRSWEDKVAGSLDMSGNLREGILGV